MSSEIRAGDRRTYWVVSNGSGYIDGVTDPGLVTTVGNGLHIYWMGTDFTEYVQTCTNVGIIPRNGDPNIPTTSDRPIVLEPFMMINNLSQKLDEITEQRNKIDQIEIISDSVKNLDHVINTITESQQQSVAQISSTISDIVAKQDATTAIVNTVASTIPGERISASQARVWLIQNGIDETAVYSAIDSIEDETLKKIVLAKWEYDTYIDRDSEWLSALGPKIGLSSSDLDRAFQEAALL